MPEGLEAEIWTRAAQTLIGRSIGDVWFDERVAPSDLADALVGCKIEDVRRRGKVMIVHTDGPALGLHFGMTGRVVIDGMAPIAKLEYASGADRAEWDRLALRTVGAAAVALRMNDPRRLGRLSLDPDLTHLGPDAMALTADELGAALAGRSAAIKTILLDQTVVAGLGNLCVDEVLFWAGVLPTRSPDTFAATDHTRIATACRERLAVMLVAGGSTTGLLDPSIRRELPPCPWDGAELRRATIAGRTAVWCAHHQT